MACVLDTDNKVGSHCGLSVVGKAFDVHPYAWTTLFQRLLFEVGETVFRVP